jgi:hypothetical protein
MKLSPFEYYKLYESQIDYISRLSSSYSGWNNGLLTSVRVTSEQTSAVYMEYIMEDFELLSYYTILCLAANDVIRSNSGLPLT